MNTKYKPILNLLTGILLSITSIFSSTAQSTYTIRGEVRDNITNAPIPYATVQIWQKGIGSVCDSSGIYEIKHIAPGTYRLEASCLGYKPTVSPEFMITNKDKSVDLLLEESKEMLKEVNIVATPFRRMNESPLSVQIIGLQEIEKSPGANRDISRVLQSFPGVASTPAFRNDLIVRGGSPSENRFFIDGVEIPNINHFATQGASGGPVGILNADFIREIKFYSGAFPSNRGEAVSSVLDFSLTDGNREKASIRAVVGASEISLSSNGPLGKKTTYSISIRRSYLQFLFKTLGLAILPTFTDGQFKIKTRFNQHHELTILGLGALDDLKLNTGMKDPGEENLYLLDYLPIIRQKNYTIGGVYKHYGKKNTQSIILSRSYLNNHNFKYNDNDDSSEENKRLDYRSDEISNKLRFENLSYTRLFKINVGAGIDWTQYNNKTFQKLFITTPVILDYETRMNLFKWSVFGTMEYLSPDEKFSASIGIRTDANTYSANMSNPLKQLSPRASFAYQITEQWELTASAGRYHQLPPYTSMGYKDNDSILINKANHLTYIRSDQFALGGAYKLNNFLRISAEGFYKHYTHAPLCLQDSIPLASKGADYGTVGDEPVSSTAKGRAYGAELMIRWFGYKNLNFIASYTYVRSEYKDAREGREKYLPTAWDNRNLFTFSGTYNFPKKWALGTKLRIVGGAPYTPVDVEKSSLKEAWDAKGQPYLDYSRYNSERLNIFTQLDIRVDKTFHFKRWMLGLYLDIQNILNNKYKDAPTYLNTGETDPDNPERYILKPLQTYTGTILPTLGIMIEL